MSAVIVDDHALLRQGPRRMIEDGPEIVVVGEAGGGQEAVQLVQRLAPQVVAMDLTTPVMDGTQATRAIMQRAPDTIVPMMSVNAQESRVRTAFEAGVRGYLLKSASEFDFGAAIKAVVSGQCVPDRADCPA